MQENKKGNTIQLFKGCTIHTNTSSKSLASFPWSLLQWCWTSGGRWEPDALEDSSWTHKSQAQTARKQLQSHTFASLLLQNKQANQNSPHTVSPSFSILSICFAFLIWRLTLSQTDPFLNAENRRHNHERICSDLDSICLISWTDLRMCVCVWHM